jgi:DNA-binding phage protein
MKKKPTRGAQRGASSEAVVRRIMREAAPTVAFEQKRARAEVAQNMRASLALRNWTGMELARRLGVERQAVYKMLAGKQGLSVENLARVANALGMSLHVSLRTPPATKPMPRDPDQHGEDLAARQG